MREFSASSFISRSRRLLSVEKDDADDDDDDDDVSEGDNNNELKDTEEMAAAAVARRRQEGDVDMFVMDLLFSPTMLGVNRLERADPWRRMRDLAVARLSMKFMLVMEYIIDYYDEKPRDVISSSIVSGERLRTSFCCECGRRVMSY